MKKIPIFIISLFFAGSVLLPGVSFADTYDDCPLTNPAETVECVGDKRFAGYQCRSQADILAMIATCSTPEETYKCLSHSCECADGYIDCPGGCQLPVPPQPVCDAQNRNTNQCSGVCTSCKSGFIEIEGNCVVSCDPTTELRTSEGCIAMETVASLIAPIFGTTLANLTASVAGILANIASDGIDYYVLVATGDGGVGVRNYLYGSGKPDVYLEADIASTVDVTGGTAGQVLTVNATEDGTEWTTPGAASVFVGISATARDGNDVIGYNAVADECAPYGAGSHVCTIDEIIRSYVTQAAGTGVHVATGNAWINNGPPGYTSNIVNDCNGWNNQSTTVFGSIWKFDTDYSMITPCSMSLKFACCK